MLPLAEEGRAVLARYLSKGRPPSAGRELFLRRRVPAGPLAATAVHDILERRVALSGIPLIAFCGTNGQFAAVACDDRIEL